MERLLKDTRASEQVERGIKGVVTGESRASTDTEIDRVLMDDRVSEQSMVLVVSGEKTDGVDVEATNDSGAQSELEANLNVTHTGSPRWSGTRISMEIPDVVMLYSFLVADQAKKKLWTSHRPILRKSQNTFQIHFILEKLPFSNTFLLLKNDSPAQKTKCLFRLV